MAKGHGLWKPTAKAADQKNEESESWDHDIEMYHNELPNTHKILTMVFWHEVVYLLPFPRSRKGKWGLKPHPTKWYKVTCFVSTTTACYSSVWKMTKPSERWRSYIMGRKEATLSAKPLPIRSWGHYSTSPRFPKMCMIMLTNFPPVKSMQGYKLGQSLSSSL